jgi:D-threonate/D-erythronate kinase
MPSLRLLADDLTGALDSSAELVGVFGPLSVFWSATSAHASQGSFAIDSGTREAGEDEAFALVRELAPMLDGATVAYKKIDSLLRGPWVAELDACLQTGLWDACIVAPAFAHQGRQTDAGQQYARTADGSWHAVGDNILAQLRRRNLDARLGNTAEALKHGISVFDAQSDDDLDRVVHIGRQYAGRILWCGSGGLASALARGTETSVSAELTRPVLGLFGSDHAATAAQLAACETIVIRATDLRTATDRISKRLGEGVSLIKFETDGASTRAEAARQFARDIELLGRSIEPPGTLLVAGGETLRSICVAIGASSLQVVGRLEPGVPKSVIQVGPWAGVDVISKSGAFGPPDLWWKLLSQNGLI